MEISKAELMTYTTVRMECDYSDGSQGMGTGFMFKFDEADNYEIPVIITNKHLIDNTIECRVVFCVADNKGRPIDTQHHSLAMIEPGKYSKYHPEEDVDLCAIPIAPFLNSLRDKGLRLYYHSFDRSFIQTSEKLSELSAIEEIIMAGYPIGIWDSHNNKPILRKGLTAIHPKLNYRNKKESVIDIACFPGSSGSPVLIYNQFHWRVNENQSLSAEKEPIILLGILYAGAEYSVEGEIEVVEIPTGKRSQAVSHIPGNLGFIISAERILELEPLFKHNK